MNTKNVKKSTTTSALKDVLAGNPLDLVLGHGSAPRLDRNLRTLRVDKSDQAQEKDRNAPRDVDGATPKQFRRDEAESTTARQDVPGNAADSLSEKPEPTHSHVSRQVVVDSSRDEADHSNAQERSAAVEPADADQSVIVGNRHARQAPPPDAMPDSVQLDGAVAPVDTPVSQKGPTTEPAEGRAHVANDQAGQFSAPRLPASRNPGEVAVSSRSSEPNGRTALQVPSVAPGASTRAPEPTVSSKTATKAAQTSEPRQKLSGAQTSPAATGHENFEESSTGTVRAVKNDGSAADGDDGRDQSTTEQSETAGRGASFRHRIGTIQEPYVRADGTKVRQWSLTLNDALIRRVSHYALDRGVKPAVLVDEWIREGLAKAGR